MKKISNPPPPLGEKPPGPHGPPRSIPDPPLRPKSNKRESTYMDDETAAAYILQKQHGGQDVHLYGRCPVCGNIHHERTLEVDPELIKPTVQIFLEKNNRNCEACGWMNQRHPEIVEWVLRVIEWNFLKRGIDKSMEFPEPPVPPPDTDWKGDPIEEENDGVYVPPPPGIKR